MRAFPGYAIGPKIYESPASSVFRANRILDNLPVILKILKEQYPTPDELVRYKQEYYITSMLDEVPGVIGVHGLEDCQNTLVIIVEDFGAESLDILRALRTFSVKECLKIGSAIADILGDIHTAGVMHKDINPSNIVLNSRSGELKIIDFGISSLLSRENPVIKSPEVLEGTLPFLSPEQTGRMNRSIDYRTDYYSLGATLYVLLTGRPPFETSDTLEMLHCHIAMHPTPPHEVEPRVPRQLSDIVMKLLAKNAEDRYQSARGIKWDLDECSRQLHGPGSISSFPLAAQDVPEQFRIPQKLYGREAPLAALIASFDLVSEGGKQITLVQGNPGIGKTSLVREIFKPVTRKRGYFISGKYDQFQGNVPYGGIVAAFREMIRQLLGESEAKLSEWREKLLCALGPNGKVITEVIPEVELIIGPPPQVPDLGPMEARNRLGLVFQDFIRVFAQPEHPLVVFLDDLQWADVSSFKLMEVMMTDSHLRCLFLVGAYRDTQVESGHPLLVSTEGLRKEGVIIDEILLGPLRLEHIIELTRDTLRITEHAAAPLARLVEQKTAGNPFFINEFLKELHAERLLQFDARMGAWHWDLNRIQAREITDNVVELMSGRIRQVGPETQTVLKLAACIGDRFDLGTLSTVHETSAYAVLKSLWEAVAQGLIFPLGDAWKSIDLNVSQRVEPSTVEYKFAHDRIHQAAYSLIPEREREALHLQIGRLMLGSICSPRSEDGVFDVVNQLNCGLSLIVAGDEKRKLAELNLAAGLKAKASAAYDGAFGYLMTGIELLGPEDWTTAYQLYLSLHVEAAESAYLCGRLQEMEALVDTVLQHAESLLDKVRAYEIRIQSYIARNKMQEALEVALPVLKLLGVNLPSRPTRLDQVLGFLRTRTGLMRKTVDQLADMPNMADPVPAAAMHILTTVAKAAYVTVTDLVPLLIFNLVNLSVRYGNAPESPFAYAAYGFFLSSVVGDIDRGYAFGQLALRLGSKLNAGRLNARTLMCVSLLNLHWKEPLRNILKPALEAYRTGLETGNVEDAAISAFIYCSGSYHAGKDLIHLERETATYSESIRRLRQESSEHLNNVFHQAILNLTGHGSEPWRLIGEAYNEEVMLPVHVQAHDKSVLSILYLNRTMLCYFFHRFEEALESVTGLKDYLDGVAGTITVALYYFYDSLVKLALHDSMDHEWRRQILKEVAANQRRIKKWARHAPMNFANKFFLIEAEVHRVSGNFLQAMDGYDQAIDFSRQSDFIHEEALANECAARFYLMNDKPSVAQGYLQAARYCWLRWGATEKVKDLEERYQDHLASRTISMRHRTTEAGSVGGTAVTMSGSREGLDLASVMKASRIISGEIVRKRLLEELVRVVIENAGAERGFLILQSERGLRIEAAGQVGNGGIEVLKSIPIDEARELSTSVVNYVARTGETVVLDDAVHHGGFVDDPYVVRTGAKSVLCAPMVHKGELTAIVYLENNLTTSAFTPDRVEVLRLLGSQAAVSLENARLYENLEQRVAERTADLEKANLDLKAEIDEKQRAQEAFQEATVTAEKANRAKSEFLANMSHELRTPLNAVIGFSELLEDQSYGALNDDQLTYVSQIHGAGEHLLQLINDILDLAKVESGKLELQLSPVDIAAQLPNSLAMIKEKAHKHSIKVDLQVSADLHGVRISADEVKLKQIMFNLLSNAVKFTPDGGSVTVRAWLESARLVVSVADTGIGIRPQDQEKVFGAFEQVDSSHARRQQGTGLGLALTRKLVELHRGSIWVESQGVDQGSTFTFSLPVE